VKLCSLAAAIASGEKAVEQLSSGPRTDDNAFEALNAAFVQDGAFISVPRDCTVADPIQLIFLSMSTDAGAASSPRNLILAGANSRMTIIESYVGFSNSPTLTNTVTEVIADEHASVEHLKFQDESSEAFHIATIRGHFGRNSNVNLHSFALGSRLSRTHIRAKLAGEGLECVLNGLYLTRCEQVADHHMIVEHAQPRCASHEYFNGILDDRSKGVFHGRILVQPIAQKTDAKQTNRNLLLSNDATVDTKPQLEIYADDVKCTHGATVGQMNEESIFYLRARGIGLEKARQILMHAFAGEIIDRVKCDPVRGQLDRIVWERLDENPQLAASK
jgi:Fe-S cluster assembly protein SufD